MLTLKKVTLWNRHTKWAMKGDNVPSFVEFRFLDLVSFFRGKSARWSWGILSLVKSNWRKRQTIGLTVALVPVIPQWCYIDCRWKVWVIVVFPDEKLGPCLQNMLRRKKSSKGHRTHNDNIPNSRHASKKVRRQRSGRRPEYFEGNHSCRPYGLDNDFVQSKHCDRNDDQPRRNSPK